MRKLLKRLSALAVVGGVVAAGFVGVAAPASATEGSVTVVQSKSEAPEGTVWTAGTTDPLTCVVTDTGVHTQPGQRHEAETELRTPYKQVIPGQTELSHQEFKYTRTVADFKTQYFFAKFTQTKTRTWVKEVPAQAATYVKWVWNGGNTGTAPAFPGPYWNKTSDTNPNKHDPLNTVYKTGNGKNASWAIYAETSPAVPGTPGHWSDWSAYGPWTLWQPVQHTSWQDSNAPIGSPEFHGQGDTWYREWQQRPTGETKQVQTGTHVETTDWLTTPPAGDGWTQIDQRKVIDQAATADQTVYFLPGGEPTTTLTDANYTATNPGSPWVKAGEDRRFETKAAYSDPDVVTNYSHTHKDPNCTLPPTPANPTAGIEAVCGAADITLTNPVTGEATQITASFVVFVDGEFHKAYSVEGNKSESVRLTFDEDSGDHTVEVFQAGTSEWKSIAKATVETDCVAPVAAPPVFKDITCEEPGTWSIPSVDGVGYFFLADGNEEWIHIGSGQYPVTDAMIGQTIKFEARWVKTGEVLGSWTHTFKAPTKEECNPVVVPPTEEPPVVTPPVTETPKPSTTPSATPTPVAPATGDLAQTGVNPVNIIGWSVLGFLVLAAGAALIAAGRRKAQAIPVKAEEQE